MEKLQDIAEDFRKCLKNRDVADDVDIIRNNDSVVLAFDPARSSVSLTSIPSTLSEIVESFNFEPAKKKIEITESLSNSMKTPINGAYVHDDVLVSGLSKIPVDLGTQEANDVVLEFEPCPESVVA